MSQMIVCPNCQLLVEVRERAVVSHRRATEECPGAGARYTSSDGLTVAGPPGVQVLHVEPVRSECGHVHSVVVVVKVHRQAMARAARN